MRRLLALVLAALAAAANALEAPLPGPPQSPATTLEWRAFRNFTSADGLPQNSVLALLQDRDGFLYAGTHHRAARYDGRRWQEVSLPTGGRNYAVGALAQSADGALWFGTDAVGAWRVLDGKAERVALPGSRESINAFWEAPDGRLWIAAFDGLFRCRASRCERIEAIGQTGARSLFGETVDGQARLWIGTNNEGVLQLVDLDAASPRLGELRFGRDDGMPNNVGLSLARFDGDLWVGSGRGLARFDGTRLHVYGRDNGFPVAMVFALLPHARADGTPVLFAALRPGGLAEIEADGRWRLIDSQHGLPSNAVHSLLREREHGALWLGTMTAGVARVERDRWALFDERMGLPDRLVLGVGWSAPTRTLWLGTAGGAARWSGERFVPLLPAPQNAQLVYDLVDAPDGTRWIAHGRGLQRWRGEVLELDYSLDQSALPAVSAERLALRHSANGFEVYVGTGHGLARWTQADGLRRVDAMPGIDAAASVRGLALRSGAAADALWVATSDGVARFDDRGWTRPDAACLADNDAFGLAVEAAPAPETVWLATRGGLLTLHPDGRCESWPAAQALGALTHVRLADADAWVFGARGVLRVARDGAPTQAGRVYGAESGLASPEIAASALDDRGRLFGATAAGLAALQPSAEPGDETRAHAAAPLHWLAATHGAALEPLAPGMALPHDDSGVRFEWSLLSFDREHAVRYRSRLQGLEAEFGPWSAQAVAAYPRLPPGSYVLRVEARDAEGAAAAPLALPFSVQSPWWQRAWARIAAALLLLALGLGLGRWRSGAARRRAQHLEDEVADRTRELAAANVLLEQAAVTDPLTGLKNRRYFALAADAEAGRARRGDVRHALVVALLDIDHFKRINDVHGHALGDAVLADVARRLQHEARGGDIVLRWGGEEFLLLLRDVERDAAPAVLQRLVAAMREPPVHAGDAQIPITASVGATCFPAAAMTLEQAIAAADAALYRAKREGRDRAVLVASDSA